MLRAYKSLNSHCPDAKTLVRPRMRNCRITWEGICRLQERLVDPLLTTLTIMIAVLLFVVAPLQVAGAISGHYVGFAFVAVLILAAFTVSGSRVAFGAILVAVGSVVTSMALEWQQPSILEAYLDALAWLIAGLTLTTVVVRAVFAPGKVTFHRIIGAVLVYLNTGLIFVGLFAFVALLAPDAFKGLGPIREDFSFAGSLIYFSFTTLTTTGFGDIVPIHPYARSLASIEAIIGQLYPAILLARLVTLELENRHSS
jgi:ion channel